MTTSFSSLPGFAVCFDASALAMIFAREPGSQPVKEFFNARPTKFATPFCLYEALGVLKRKWLQKKLSKAAYFDAAGRLTAWHGASSKSMQQLDFSDPSTFNQAQAIAQREDIDLSDAFQIVSIKQGWYSVLIGGSATMFVTADATLADVARREGIRVWDCLREASPPAQ